MSAQVSVSVTPGEEGGALALPEADPTADPAILAPSHHLGHHVLAAGHHAPAHGYGYEAAGYYANGGQCVPPVKITVCQEIQFS